MTIKMNNIIKISLIAASCLVLSACGGSKKTPVQVDAANSTDITRPPVIVKDEKAVEAEKNPEETISFDEWKKKRDAELTGEVKPTP